MLAKKNDKNALEKDRLIEFPEVFVGFGNLRGMRCKRFTTKTGKGLSPAVSMLPCLFEDGSLIETARNLVKVDPDGSLEKTILKNKMSSVQFVGMLWEKLGAGLYQSEISALRAKHGMSARELREVLRGMLKKKKIVRDASKRCSNKGEFYIRKEAQQEEGAETSKG